MTLTCKETRARSLLFPRTIHFSLMATILYVQTTATQEELLTTRKQTTSVNDLNGSYTCVSGSINVSTKW